MPCRSGAVRSLWSFLCVPCLFLATLAFAGTNGKIMGVVTDVNKSPLPGVAVTVEGTRLGASTDPDGHYLILQVPPGHHTAKAQLIGYRAMKVADIRVRADLTSQVSFMLEEETIKVDAMVVTAKRAIIEQDVTSSQIILDAKAVESMPVSRMLDMLSYEPGVSVNSSNDLSIRGGGASEIRFQIDGQDRTDAITSKGQSNLNQVLVAEVTVLTGGFNAEYGNVRSGVVNAVFKDGTEGSSGLPWVAGAVSYTPTQRKHRGPGAYDSDQYDYWLRSSKSPFDSVALERALYWPELYAETRADTAFMKDFQKIPYKVFGGWAKAASGANFAGLGRGAFGSKKWTAEAAREAWEWEANMDEQVWTYAHKPDLNVDLAMGWALPAKLGGIILGYSFSRNMTPVPALIPETIRKALDVKLTLTPIDELKMSLRYSGARSSGTGAGSNTSDPELAASGTAVLGGDPNSLSSFGDLEGSISGGLVNNKLNLSNNSPLHGEYDQVGGMVTYTIGPKMFAATWFSWSRSEWNTTRDDPRIDVNNFDDRYIPRVSWGYGDWLTSFYRYSDKDGDGRPDPFESLEDALTPGRVIERTPFSPNVYREVPTEGRFVTKEFIFTGKTGVPDTALVVSPQGWVEGPYSDMSGGLYGLGGGGRQSLLSRSTSFSVKSDVTRVIGLHTVKVGGEIIRSDVQSTFEINGGATGNFRDYGGRYPSCRPVYLGFYIEDKYESEGMNANVGIRLERFNGGQKAHLYDDLFNEDMFTSTAGRPYYLQAAKDMLTKAGINWDAAWGGIPDYETMKDCLGVAPGPWTVAHYTPGEDAKSHWRISPRFGVAHPVTEKTKFFFNFGDFYSMQKGSVMYGYMSHNSRPGAKHSWFQAMYNPNLRPAKTTMYEVGVEHVLTSDVVTTVRGYAKYNVDQVSDLEVIPVFDGGAAGPYKIFRNTDYEDIKGGEIKISRSIGRFVNGWYTYELFYSRSGNAGLSSVSNDPAKIAPYTPYTRNTGGSGSWQAGVILSTPTDWGWLKGDWSLTTVGSFSRGGEVVYNPLELDERLLKEDNYLPVVDSWSTTFKLSKRISLKNRRTVMVYMDIFNPWNRKSLPGGGDYVEYIYTLRQNGSDVKYGDPSTFHIFTRPYKTGKGEWHEPLAAERDWLLYKNPRTIRFGVTFNV
jgi:hypothetical protein